ncbi:TOM1-like protein 2 [Lamellibrachia satsuma]|nr:TOM1-like protein 2 [Lamellibrachia satsuma]
MKKFGEETVKHKQNPRSREESGIGWATPCENQRPAWYAKNGTHKGNGREEDPPPLGEVFNMAFFKDIGSGNPFSSPVGQLIEKATDGAQASENWALYMEICDVINETEDGPKDGVRAIRRRLSTAGKNYTSVMYTLTVLETCVKNCGQRFHVHIVQKDFLQEMIKIIGPKNDPPQIVQEKVLSLIQTWADAFQQSPDMREVGRVYQDLKSKGIEFPMTSLDHMAPIHTPAKTFGESPEQPVGPASSRGSAHRPTSVKAGKYTLLDESEGPYHSPPQRLVTQGAPATSPVAAPVTIGPDQLAKLRSELDIVDQNRKVLSDMLTELTPGPEQPDDHTLLKDLNNTCRQMQKRVVELVATIQNEEVTSELLRINDELNNVFLRFDRYQRQHEASCPTPAGGVPQHLPADGSTRAGDSTVATGSLIDLGSPEPISTSPATLSSDVHVQMAAMNVRSGRPDGALTGDENDFDMFAQSRQSFDQNMQNRNDYSSQTQPQFEGTLGAAVTAKTGNVMEKESDYDEMEKWLAANKSTETTKDTGTTSEFDQFLAGRVKEAEEVPPGDGTSRGNTRGGRLMQKGDADNTLFAL